MKKPSSKSKIKQEEVLKKSGKASMTKEKVQKRQTTLFGMRISQKK